MYEPSFTPGQLLTALLICAGGIVALLLTTPRAVECPAGMVQVRGYDGSPVCVAGRELVQ